MPRSLSPSTGGFTLLELITTMAVGIVLVGFAVPSMTQFMRSQRAVTVAGDFHSAVSKARTIAAASNSYVTIAPIEGDWRKGWQVFNEHVSPDGEYAGSDSLIAESNELPLDVTITTSTTPAGLSYITFSPAGYSQTTGKAQMSMKAGFQIGTSKRVVDISLLGRSRICNPDTAPATCAMP